MNKNPHLALASFQQLFILPSGLRSCGEPCRAPLLSNRPHPQNVHHNESLVWFKTSGYWYMVTLDPHGNSSQIPYWYTPRITEILQLSFCRTGPFLHSSRSEMGQLLGWANPRLRMRVWVVADRVGLSHWDYRLRWRGRASSPSSVAAWTEPSVASWCGPLHFVGGVFYFCEINYEKPSGLKQYSLLTDL